MRKGFTRVECDPSVRSGTLQNSLCICLVSIPHGISLKSVRNCWNYFFLETDRQAGTQTTSISQLSVHCSQWAAGVFKGWGMGSCPPPQWLHDSPNNIIVSGEAILSGENSGKTLGRSELRREPRWGAHNAPSDP